jgi:hypothetical protein
MRKRCYYELRKFGLSSGLLLPRSYRRVEDTLVSVPQPLLTFPISESCDTPFVARRECAQRPITSALSRFPGSYLRTIFLIDRGWSRCRSRRPVDCSSPAGGEEMLETVYTPTSEPVPIPIRESFPWLVFAGLKPDLEKAFGWPERV